MWKSVQKQKCKKLYMFMLKLCTATRGQCEKQGEANTVWGSEVMIMQIRSLLWIKTEIWKRLKLCFCHSVLLMNSAVALSSVTVSFSTRHIPAQPHCTQCSVGVLVNIMQVCLCSLYVGGIPAIPFCIAQHLCKVTPAQGHYSSFSASRFNAGLTLITLI